jgi:hypothetical protein
VIPDKQILEYAGRMQALINTKEFVFTARKEENSDKRKLVYANSS